MATSPCADWERLHPNAKRRLDMARRVGPLVEACYIHRPHLAKENSCRNFPHLYECGRIIERSNRNDILPTRDHVSKQGQATTRCNRNLTWERPFTPNSGSPGHRCCALMQRPTGSTAISSRSLNSAKM